MNYRIHRPGIPPTAWLITCPWLFFVLNSFTHRLSPPLSPSKKPKPSPTLAKQVLTKRTSQRLRIHAMPDTNNQLPTAAVSLAVQTRPADPVLNLEIRINGEISRIDIIPMCIDPRSPRRVTLHLAGQSWSRKRSAQDELESEHLPR